MATKVILSIFLCAFVYAAQSQTPFYKTYGDNGYDTGNDVIQLAIDSSFVITGSSSSSGDSPNQVVLLHVDKLGNYLSSYFYGGSRSDIGVRIMHKPGVGYWIAGYSNSFSIDANFDFYVVKINEQYEKVWEKTYGTSNWERLHDALLLPDEGLVLVGEVEGIGVVGKDAVLIRTDEDGEVLWQQTYSGSSNDVAYSCIQFDESSMLIAGAWGTGQHRPWVARFDFEGNIIWSRNDYMTEDRTGEIRALQVTPDRIHMYGNWSPIDQVNEIYRPLQCSLHPDNSPINIQYENGVKETHKSLCVLRPYKVFGVAQENNIDVLGDEAPRASIFGFESQGYYIGFSHFVHGRKVTPSRIITTLDTCAVLVGSISDPDYSLGGSNVLLLKITEETTSLEEVSTNQIVSLQSFEETGLLLFPNPTINTVNISLPEGVVANMYRIFDTQGKEVLKGEFSGEINFEALDNGIYLISLETNLGLRSIRVQKK